MDRGLIALGLVLEKRMRLAVLVAVSGLLFAANLTEAATPDERLAQCPACHGANGKSDNPEIPSLGAQQEAFILVQLYMFRGKLREVEAMNDVAKDFSDDDLRTISAAIAKLPAPPPASDASDAAKSSRALELIAQHRCNSCHTPNFAGQDQIPRLADQREEYLLKSLRGYKSGDRRAYDPAMASVVEPLTDQDFIALAYYLARVK
jgi:cytochrome c553